MTLLKRCCYFLIIVLLTACATAPTSLINSVPDTNEVFYQEVPFTVVNGKIIVDVKVNGADKRFMISTGQATLIKESIFYDFNENIIGETKVQDIFDKSKTNVVCEINTFDFGGTVFRDIPSIVVEDQNPVFDCLEIDGIIGANLFAHSILHIDRKHGALIISNDNKRFLDVNPYSGVPFEKNPATGAPMLMLKVNDKAKVKAIFDCAAPDFFSMANEHYEKLKEFGVLDLVEKAYGYHPAIDIYGQARPGEFMRSHIQKLSAGTMDFYGVNSRSLGSVDKSRIGADILNYCQVTIDFNKSKIYFRPYTRGVEVKVNDLRWPVEYAYVEGARRVGLVWQAQYEELSRQIYVGEDEVVFPEGFCKYMTTTVVPGISSSKTLISKNAKGDILKTKLLAY